MGDTYFALEDYENAEALFRNSLSIEPNYESAHSNLGTVYRRLGQLKKSLSCYKEAIKINPENPNNYYSRAITIDDANKLAEVMLQKLTGIFSKN